MGEAPSILTAPTFEKGLLFGDVEQPKTSIVEESSTQQYALGTKLTYNDGRIFRYAKNGGTALAKAYMTTGEAAYANVIAETQATSGTSVEVGDYEIVIDVTTGGTYVENEFAGGTLYVEDGTGVGDVYTVLANKIDGSDDTLMRVLLLDPIRTAWAADTVITLVKSKWRDVDVMPTTAELPPAGVPLIAVTINYYCWLQTGGYAALVIDTSETLVKGEPAGHPGTPNVAGAVGDIEAATDAQWGITVHVGAGAGKAGLVNLTIDT